MSVFQQHTPASWIHTGTQSTGRLIVPGILQNKSADKLKLTTMYYLWKRETSDPNKIMTYLTDYLEQKNGKTWVDGAGWMQLELLFSHQDKKKVIEYSMDMLLHNQ